MSQKFDPMTGEPIIETEQIAEDIKEEKIVGYDPMTGEPIKENAKQEENVIRFDPMTGRPVGEKIVAEKKQMPKKFLIAGAAVIAVGIGIVAGVSSGAFLSKQNKVLLATANTLQDQTDLTEAFQAMELLSSDSYTLSVNGEIGSNAIEATLASKGSTKQIAGKLDISGMPEIEGTIDVDTKEMRIKTDYTDDTVFVYAYTKENDGYFVDSMGEENIEMLNQLLVNLTSTKKQENLKKDLAKVVREEWKDWEFEKAEKEEFEIDGKDRNCKGYQTTVTEDDILDLVDASYDVLSDLLGEEVADIYYEDFTRAFDNMEDTDITFYLYKNKLAAIIIEDESGETEIQFCGGTARWQNIIVKQNHETIFRLYGETNGSMEEYELQKVNTEVATLAYDKKSGELEVEVGNELSGMDILLDANLKGNKNEFTFTLDSLNMSGYNLDCSGEIAVKKGAKIKKISGEEFDLGNADEDEYKEMVRDLNGETL